MVDLDLKKDIAKILAWNGGDPAMTPVPENASELAKLAQTLKIELTERLRRAGNKVEAPEKFGTLRLVDVWVDAVTVVKIDIEPTSGNLTVVVESFSILGEWSVPLADPKMLEKIKAFLAKHNVILTLEE